MPTFRARARTVDMLGRQQIVGVPTAVSELFKNAYDAYAHRAEVDFFRKSQTFMLRDDGIGMTPEDVERRWLVLGTESKTTKLAGEGGEAPIPPPEGFAPRPVLGEKGIGRLAISTVGPVTLMVTRAKRGTRLHAPVAVLVAWELFEVPGIDLDRVEVPLRVLPAGTMPSGAVVRGMVEDVQSCIRRLRVESFSPRFDSAERHLEELAALDPAVFVETAGGLTLKGDGHGTMFFVRPTNPLLEGDLDDEERESSDLLKTLGGFVNEFTPGAQRVDFGVSFRDHPRDGGPARERLGPREFFSPEDFDAADHALVGAFDGEGTFRGRLRIFDAKPLEIVVPPRRTRGPAPPRSPGPFRLTFAYVQGKPKQSLLAARDPARYERTCARLDELGGVYLYRDGMRIQPYGGPANDWLGVEKNRTKSASYYFFSYRRMIGAVELTRAANPNLQEKAGREGFQENAEYRRIRLLIGDLLVHLAAQYFREDSPDPRWRDAREALTRSEETRRRLDELNRTRRNEFSKALEAALDELEAGHAEATLRAVVERYEGSLRQALGAREESDLFAAVEAAQRRAIKGLVEARDQYRVARPQGVGLTHGQQQAWAVYQALFRELSQTQFARERTRIDTVTERVLGEVRAEVDRRKLLRIAADEAARKARARVRAARGALEDATTTLQKEVVTLTRATASAIDREVDALNARVEALVESASGDTPYAELSLDGVADTSAEHLESIRAMLNDVVKHLRDTEHVASSSEKVEALEEELLARREREDANAALLQIGMAIEVIEHEFTQSVRGIREAIGALKPWADRNPGLKPIHQKLRTTFAHLDGYLSLFTPFHRRLQQQTTTFSGDDLHRYLTNLFKARLAEHEIELSQSDAFRARQITGYPSTFYPAFVNLVDNACFWLQGQRPPRRVELDAHGEALLVRDNGPGVARRDRERIFEAGFSRKPGGRGLGLRISRDVLGREGWTLAYEDAPGGGAQFAMTPKGNGP